MINQQQFIKDKIEEALDDVVFRIDGHLLKNQESIIYVYQGILSIVKEKSSMPKTCFKTTTAHEISIKEKSGLKYAITSYDEHKFLYVLLKAMKFDEYDIKSDCWHQFLPNVNSYGAMALLSWGIHSLNTPKTKLKGIRAIDSVFKLLIENTPSAHYQHMTTFGIDETQDKRNHYDSCIVNETARFRYNEKYHSVIFSNTHYLYMTGEGKERTFVTGEINNNDSFMIDEIEFIATPDGLTTLHMLLIGSVNIERIDVKQLIYDRENKTKSKII